MPPQLSCPACGGTQTELLAGRELQIVDVRWEDGPVPRTAHPRTDSEER